MKKITIAFLFLLAGVCAGAQKPRQLDSLKYILPQFSQGTVLLADRQINRGELNISPLDQAVYCISPQKDTLYVANNQDIVSVSVAGRSFVKWRGSFVEIVARNSGTGIGIIRSVAKVSNVKTGAFGMSSSTSFIKSYSVDTDSGVYEKLIIDDPRNYIYTKSVCLTNNGKCLVVSKKSFEKVFPGKKAYIESVWDGLNLSSEDVDGVIAFYNELIQD